MGIIDAQRLGDTMLDLQMKLQRMLSKRYCIRETYRNRSLTMGDKWYTAHEWMFYYDDGSTEMVTRREFTNV